MIMWVLHGFVQHILLMEIGVERYQGGDFEWTPLA